MLIGKKAQRSIMRLKVAVAGCGVVGLPLIIILSKMGVATLRILDNDYVKIENLANTLFFKREHVGSKKADAAAKLARSWSLRKTRAEAFSLDVTDEGEWDRLNSFVESTDLVYGCFDNLPARFSLNSATIVQNVKYIDLGIEGFSGRIRLIDRNRACYACDPLVPEDASINIFSLTRMQGKGCDYAPTVTILPTTILTAAHALVEGLKFLGILEGDVRYDYVYYDFLSSVKPVKMRISKRRDCRICGADGLMQWYGT